MLRYGTVGYGTVRTVRYGTLGEGRKACYAWANIGPLRPHVGPRALQECVKHIVGLYRFPALRTTNVRRQSAKQIQWGIVEK